LQRCKTPRLTFICLLALRGAHPTSRTDPGDDEDHHRRELVEAELEGDLEIVGGEPGVQRLLDRPLRRIHAEQLPDQHRRHEERGDRKSTRLNSSHVNISYGVFYLKA